MSLSQACRREDATLSTAQPMSLLLVEDDDEFRETCALWMTRKGHDVAEAANGQEALHQCARRHFDLAVVDMNMPGITGLELLQRLRADNVEMEVVILTGQATVETAVQAMKLGACDYLSKPFPLPELEKRVRHAFERAQLQKENRQLRSALDAKHQLVGTSPALKTIMDQVRRAAPTTATVTDTASPCCWERKGRRLNAGP